MEFKKHTLRKAHKKIREFIRSYAKMLIILGGFSLTVSPCFAFNSDSPDIQNEKGTLDKIKSNGISFLNHHSDNYELTNVEHDGDLSININGSTYYFTPNDTLSSNDKLNFKNLISVGSSALVETTAESAMFSIIDNENSENNKYYRYDTSKLPTSSLHFSTGVAPTYDDEGNIVDAGDYNFKASVVKDDGKLETKYYKYNTSKSAVSKITSILSSKVPTLSKLHGQDSTMPQSAFEYTNLDENGTNINIIPENLAKFGDLTVESTTEGDPDKLTVTYKNGAKQYLKTKLSNLVPTLSKLHEQNPDIPKSAYDFKENNRDINLLSQNIGKSANITYSKGIETDENKVIVNLPNETSYLKYSYTPTDYDENYTTRQTVIAPNENERLYHGIEYSNSGNLTGGAQYNGVSHDNLTADFIGNSLTSTTGTTNGTFYNNNQQIGSFTGDFINNSVTAKSYGYGSALSNYGANAIIDNLTGDFIGNLTLSQTKEASGGGAIYNSNGTINNLNGNFIANGAESQATYANGGAIWNNKIIGNITGDFIANTSKGKTYAQAGAIYNTGANAIINNLTGDFIANTATGETTSGLAGAILNTGTIDSITGNFISNSSTGATNANSGALYNSKTIGDITGNFLYNSTNSGTKEACGGAIFNSGGTLGDIKGSFVNNLATSIGANAQGGAIWNNKIIGNIEGDFVSNQISSKTAAFGGAIYNYNTTASIDSITGNFIDNLAFSETKEVHGGGLFNSGTVGGIKGDFIANRTQSDTNYATSGAIYNSKIIGDIEGNFIANSAKGKTYGQGSAIFNNGVNAIIGDITGDFIANNATGETTTSTGGAIRNDNGVIGNIAGDFINNSVTGATQGFGGAIYNNKIIGDITGDFINNSANAGNNYSYGGAMYNTSANAIIGAIKGDFIGNSATSESNRVWGGAVMNDSAVLQSITGNFIQNKTLTSSLSAGAGIYNSGGTISFLKGDFIENSSTSTGANAYAGAIYNTKIIDSIEGDFISNSIEGYTTVNGGAIYNTGATAVINSITGDFIANSATSNSTTSSGGAIWNNKIINNITGDFIANSSHAKTQSYGGAIVNSSASAVIDNLTGDFIGNLSLADTKEANGGGLSNSGTVGDIKGDFISNSATSNGTSAAGGAVYNNKIINNIEGDFISNTAYGHTSALGGAILYTGANVVINNITGDFTDNLAFGETAGASGGAIYSYNSVNVGDITGDFIGNSAYGYTTGYGGGIMITTGAATYGDITGDFIGNLAFGDTKEARGGAIYNSGGTLGDIKGDFKGNIAQSDGTYAESGAIWNNKIINSIEGDFIENAAIGTTYANAGALLNSGANAVIENLKGNFKANKAEGKGTYAQGSAIYNSGTINNIVGDFSENSAIANTYIKGGTLMNNGASALIGSIEGDFSENSAIAKTSIQGGTIYNTGTINNIEGDFTNNYVENATYGDGGIIWNNNTIGNIKGDFKYNTNARYNTENKSSSSMGGVIHNKGVVTNIEGDFEGNKFIAGISSAMGGTIYNTKTINNIKGNFIQNHTESSSYAYSGAICNIKYSSNDEPVIDNIEGNFIGNSIVAGTSAYGGGIVNSGGNIINITGDFISNSIVAGTSAYGGGMYNNGNTNSITGDFIGNSITAGNYAYGGGMLGYIGNNLTGDFIGNSITAGTDAYGGGMYGYADNITGDFIGNSITAGTDAYGGGMYRINKKGNNIISDFINNSITAETYALGGGLYAYGGKILSFIGDFIDNTATSNSEYVQGGGMYLFGENAFERYLAGHNSKNLEEVNAYLSYIKEQRKQTLLTSKNMTEEEYNTYLANLRQTSIDNLVTEAQNAGYDNVEEYIATISDYTNLDEYVLKVLKRYKNMEEYLNATGYVATIQEEIEYYGYSTLDEMIAGRYSDVVTVIENYKGNIIGNKAISKNDVAQGGGLFNKGKIAIYDSDITLNKAIGNDAKGGAIYNGGEFAELFLVASGKDLTFAGNETVSGGKTESNAIHNNEAIIYLNTSNNVADSSINNGNTDGRIVIQDKVSGDSGIIEVNKDINQVLYTESVLNPDTQEYEEVPHNIEIDKTNGVVEFHNDVKGNNINVYNGGIVVAADNNDITLGSGNETLLLKDGVSELNFVSTGNNNLTSNIKIDSEEDNATLNINKPDTVITKTSVNSDINSEDYGKVTNTRHSLSKDELTGNVILSNDVNVSNVNIYNGKLTLEHNISSENINLYDGTINFGKDINLDSSQYLNAYGGGVDLRNGTAGNTNLGNLRLNSDLDLKADVDIKNNKTDSITVSSLVNNGEHKINLSNIKVLNPIKSQKFTASVIGDMNNEDLRKELMSTVEYTGKSSILTPIYRYNVKYDKELGELTFCIPSQINSAIGTDMINPTYNDVNPAVMTSTVTRNSVAYAVQANAYYEGFRSLNETMYLTRAQRFALKISNKNRNKYAFVDSNVDSSVDVIKGKVDDVNVKSDTVDSLLRSGVRADEREQTGWFKTNTTFETVKLKDGPKTDNVLYSAFVGFDSELNEIEGLKVLKGWDYMYGGYVGYNGGHQKFDGVSSYSNGANLGLTLNLFKGNFFSGTTLGSGIIMSEGSTMYGSENFNTLTAGIANKTGYNIEFKDGKYILQPSLSLSYSMFNTLDYTNSANVKIKSDILHMLSFEPGVKFIANLGNGWQPYLGVSFVSNFDMGGEVKANDVILPEVSVKPYVKYGVGVRKIWKDRFAGFVQAYLTNGGRNGIGLQFGFDFLFDWDELFRKNKEKL